MKRLSRRDSIAQPGDGKKYLKKEGFVKPIIVLTIICLVVAGLLGYMNSITDPIITEAAAREAEEARQEVLPEAEGFTEVDLASAGLPDAVYEAYTADNGAGSVFFVSGAGYGGEIKAIVGVNADGTVSGSKVLEHAETAGLGARITGEEFRNQFIGKDASLEGVDVISGSTISSKAYIKLISAALEAQAISSGEGA